ncbi:MAG: hypothetical protein H7X93_08525 [Sphingomonadaceae bacterium]|nr:hypothetical protein [Sphingomonadaceae bacterium]
MTQPNSATEETPRWPLSTGVRMLLALALALLPLGIVAIVASIETASTARADADSESRLVAEVATRRLDGSVTRAAITVRTATAAMTPGPDQINCHDTLNALAGIQQFTLHLAVYRADGALACLSDGYLAPASASGGGRTGLTIDVDAAAASIRFAQTARGGHVGVAELPADALRAMVAPIRPIDDYRLSLIQGGSEIVVHDWRSGAPARVRAIDGTIADRAIAWRFEYEARPMRVVEALSILLPIAMLLVAAILSWFLVRQTLLGPLGQLERAVSGYRAGDESFASPLMDRAAHELRSLGGAFEQMVATARGHEDELEAGIAEQTRLTREVHHRVKNNLQVIASLLNLHARGARTPEIAEAYASIQRRVDALAIVQRNLFAEADSARGIPVRPVIAELASSLQQSAPGSTRLMLSLNVADVRVSQDIAAPMAFLVTELVELAMLSGGASNLGITVGERDPATGRALFTICCPGPDGEALSNSSRYARVLSGLSRQLRAALEQDPVTGAYAIEVPTLEGGSP